MEYAGYQLIRGCGCRGGICGACGTVYRFPGSYKIEVGLACQTIVQPNMYLAQIPFFPATKSVYDIEKIKPNIETLVKAYPELLALSPVQYLHQVLSHGYRGHGLHRGGDEGRCYQAGGTLL